MNHLLTNCLLHTEDTRTLVFVQTSFNSVCVSKLQYKYFAIWTSQSLNKSIVSDVYYSVSRIIYGIRLV